MARPTRDREANYGCELAGRSGVGNGNERVADSFAQAGVSSSMVGADPQEDLHPADASGRVTDGGCAATEEVLAVGLNARRGAALRSLTVRSRSPWRTYVRVSFVASRNVTRSEL